MSRGMFAIRMVSLNEENAEQIDLLHSQRVGRGNHCVVEEESPGMSVTVCGKQIKKTVSGWTLKTV